jgi:hypothetical protein
MSYFPRSTFIIVGIVAESQFLATVDAMPICAIVYPSKLVFGVTQG